MRYIKPYLIEKLHLNKDIKIDKDRIGSSPLSLNEAQYRQMLSALLISEKDEQCKPIFEWVHDNKFIYIKGVIKLKTLKALIDHIKKHNMKTNIDELSKYYSTDINLYKKIVDEVLTKGTCSYKKKDFQGRYLEIRDYKNYLIYRELDSQEYIAFEGDPYGPLG